MQVRSIIAAFLLIPLIGAANSGPSTQGERTQALETIHRFQADPFDPQLQPAIQ